MTARLGISLLFVFAGAAVAQSDPSRDGAYLVRQVDIPVRHPGGGQSTLRTFLPAAADRARPTVIVIHGLWMAPGAYEDYARNLASRGFAAALYDQYSRFSSDLSAWVAAGSVAIDGLERANADPSSGVMGELDLGQIGVIGHSYGGMTSIGMAARDSRVKAVVAVAPGAALRDLLLRYASQIRTQRVLVITGQLDGLATANGFGKPVYDTLPTPDKLYVELAGATHMGFVFGLGQETLTRRYGNAWFDRWLLGAADTQGYTDGSYAARDQGVARVVAPAGASSFSGPRPGRVTTDELNVRSGPGTSHPVQAVLNAGQQVAVQESSSGWYRITWAGAPQGALWVAGRYVELARMGTVATAELNVRSGPGTSHPVVGVRRQGEVVEVLGEQSGWLRVRWEGAPSGELWVSGAYISG